MPGVEKLSKPKEKFFQEEERVVISTVDPKLVLDNVLKQLGKPTDMAAVSANQTRATPISQYAFRVNICRMTPHLTLTDSFFVRVNDKGQIAESDPAISKKY